MPFLYAVDIIRLMLPLIYARRSSIGAKIMIIDQSDGEFRKKLTFVTMKRMGNIMRNTIGILVADVYTNPPQKHSLL